jgi:type II secretory pathway pseudopilin PulG
MMFIFLPVFVLSRTWPKEKFIMSRRNGMALMELLIVIGIIAVLIGLLIPAVMKIREAALRAESMNNQKQIALAIQNYVSVNENCLPSLDGNGQTFKPGPSVFAALLPFVEQENAVKQMQDNPKVFIPVKVYHSPADPTLYFALGLSSDWHREVGSYAANACALDNNPRFPASFSDGTSNTILFAEHYAFNCGGTNFGLFWSMPPGLTGIRRASFADVSDIIPETSGNPPTTSPSTPGYTFQVAPRPQDCGPRIPQTPHRSGMVTSMADGSVRIIAPGVSPNIFWGAVTPAGGEVLGNLWE